MPRVAAVASLNDFKVAVIDFTKTSNLSVAVISPSGTGGGCKVAVKGPTLAIGSFLSGTVLIYDVTNPAAPALEGSIDTKLSGIGAIAVRGSLVAVGENVNSYEAHVMLLDISTPSAPVIKGSVKTPLASVSTAAHGLGAVASVAFLNDNVVFASGPADSRVFQIDFTTPSSPVVTPFAPGVSGGACLSLDSSAGTLAVGDTSSGLLKLFNANTLVQLGSDNTVVLGINSVAVKNDLVMVGGPNSIRVDIVDFSTAPPAENPYNPGLSGGYKVAMDDSTGVCADMLGSKVVFLDLIKPAQPAHLGSIDSTLLGLTSLSVTHFTPPMFAFAFYNHQHQFIYRSYLYMLKLFKTFRS